MRFKRILLKLSGESLMGEQKYGIDERRLAERPSKVALIPPSCSLISIVIMSLFYFMNYLMFFSRVSIFWLPTYW